MTKAQNSKLAQTPEHSLSRNVWVIGISDLDIICHLEFEIWDFRLVIRETKYLHLNRIKSTLMLPLVLFLLP